MRISDWSSDVCSSDLHVRWGRHGRQRARFARRWIADRWPLRHGDERGVGDGTICSWRGGEHRPLPPMGLCGGETCLRGGHRSRVEQGLQRCNDVSAVASPSRQGRSDEHTSELQSLMRTSYAVFCLKKKKKTK